jgi:hypothetical protein
MDWRYVRFKYETFLLASFLLPSTQYVKPGRENGHEIATPSARNDRKKGLQ